MHTLQLNGSSTLPKSVPPEEISIKGRQQQMHPWRWKGLCSEKSTGPDMLPPSWTWSVSSLFTLHKILSRHPDCYICVCVGERERERWWWWWWWWKTYLIHVKELLTMRTCILGISRWCRDSVSVFPLYTKQFNCRKFLRNDHCICLLIDWVWF